MLELGRVSRSSFYRFDPEGQPGTDRDMELRDAIQRIALEMPSYGRPRMTADLRRRGSRVNPKRVYRLLREDNLLCAAAEVRRHHRLQSRAQDLSQPGPRAGVDGRKPALDCRSNLHPAAAGVRVPAGNPGCLLPPGDRAGRWTVVWTSN